MCSSHNSCFYVKVNYFASLLDFPNNAYSGSARSTLLRKSSNQIAGTARHLYLINNNVFIDGNLKTSFLIK